MCAARQSRPALATLPLTATARSRPDFCDDLEPPCDAFGWSADRLRAFFESGGDGAESAQEATAGLPTLPPAAPAAPAPAPPAASAGRPIVLCLGEATTEFGMHVINQSTAELGSSKHKASLSVTVDPVATEFLRMTNTDNPRTEHGPGWISLLARDYSWRTTADVINRGYSGMTSALLRADLAEIVGSLQCANVVAVVLMIGANDAIEAGQPMHVPLQTYKENMEAIVKDLKVLLPHAGVLVISPAPVDEKQWQLTVSQMTNGRKDGKDRSASRTKEYAAAARAVADRASVKYVDLGHKLQYEFANAMMELQNPVRDGLHFTRAVNIYVYRLVKGMLDEFGLSAAKLPPHWPKHYSTLYAKEVYGDDDGKIRKRAYK
jgi:lysophospholipase L1-like esterase